MSKREVVVLGWSAAPLGRPGLRGDETGSPEQEGSLACEVVGRALDQAKVDPSRVDALVMPGPAPSTSQHGFANFVASRLGLQCRAQLTEVSNLGLSGGLAFDLAASEVLLGRADFAVAAGVEMPSPMRTPAAPATPFASVSDVHFEAQIGATPISWYAMSANRYLYEANVSRKALAEVAVKNRRHAALNPLAQYRKPIAVQDVLQARPICEPLGLLDVAPISNGAICVVLGCREKAGSAGIRLAGRGFGHDGQFQAGYQSGNLLELKAARQATKQALEQAALGMDDLDLAELYAPTTITEILVTEAIGLSPPLQGGDLASSGATALGGKLPINTSGGCLSRGHPPGLSGLYGVLEICEQLSHVAGDRQVADARRGLSLCEGGLYNVALAHILERTT